MEPEDREKRARGLARSAERAKALAVDPAAVNRLTRKRAAAAKPTTAGEFRDKYLKQAR